jgi:hypothetical protein
MINVDEVENIAYYGAQAALVRIHLSGAPTVEAMTQIRTGNPHVLSADIRPID